MNAHPLVSFCGLYCGACGKYIKGTCAGCAGNEKAAWCGVRSCCLKKNIASCADCSDYPNPYDCADLNNFISKVIGFLKRSDRIKGIRYIREHGYEAFARHMAERNLQCMKKSDR